jgi:hypothetical protein
MENEPILQIQDTHLLVVLLIDSEHLASGVGDAFSNRQNTRTHEIPHVYRIEDMCFKCSASTVRCMG